MKNVKKAFSMAELLLTISIIGVVSAMGMTISKQAADKAYNQFYYYGYINLYNVIAEIGNNFNANRINSMIGSTQNPDGNRVTTTNGIIYEVDNPNIIMTIPQRKTRNNNGQASVTFRYIETNAPADVSVGQLENVLLVPLTGGSVNLQDRRDLLLAYIDDGVVGRIKRTAFNGNNYDVERIRYYSYRQAVCAIRGGNTAQANIPNVLTCTTLNNNELPPVNARTGVLRFENPRRAR